jgi:hypothetical protein
MLSEQAEVEAARPTATLTTLRMTKEELGSRIVCVAGSLLVRERERERKREALAVLHCYECTAINSAQDARAEEDSCACLAGGSRAGSYKILCCVAFLLTPSSFRLASRSAQPTI